MNKKYALLYVLTQFTLCSVAQLNVTPSGNAVQLAQMIVGRGVIVSNAALSGSFGSAGIFSGHSSIGLDSGIMLTNGLAALAEGPNNLENAGYAWGAAGDQWGFSKFNQPARS